MHITVHLYFLRANKIHLENKKFSFCSLLTFLKKELTNALKIPIHSTSNRVVATSFHFKLSKTSFVFHSPKPVAAT